MAYGAGLESQLGAISQGFESLILRQTWLHQINLSFKSLATFASTSIISIVGKQKYNRSPVRK